MGRAGPLTGSLTEPQRSWAHAEVPAPDPRPWPADMRPLDVTITGAGRIMDLAEFHARTATTALVVIAGGVLVHEQYMNGTRPEDRLLGYSATKSALALVVGLASDAGLPARLSTRRSRRSSPSWRAAGTPPSRCASC